MTYIKPLCECESELILVVHEMNSMDFRIYKNGKHTKSPVAQTKEAYGTELSCFHCGNMYVCEFDDKNRLVRGGLDREGF